MKHVLISDTHGDYTLLKNLPAADVLIHCGDATRFGSRDELKKFAKAFGRCVAPMKILIAGNHDRCFEKHWKDAVGICALEGIFYLQDSAIVHQGIKYYGMPWTPAFNDWYFMATEAKMIEKVNKIPLDTDVLITHGPPKYVRDLSRGEFCGSMVLNRTVYKLQPKLHVFGHIHEGYGTVELDDTQFVNCSLLDGYYQPVNLPIICTLKA